MEELIKVSVNVPFPTDRAARIAYDVLRIDAEPKRNHIRKNYELDSNILKVEFSGEIAKNIRTALTNFYESLILCVETQQEFGLADPSATYDYY